MSFLFVAADTRSNQVITTYMADTRAEMVDAAIDWCRDYWTQNGAPEPEWLSNMDETDELLLGAWQVALEDDRARVAVTEI